VHFVYGLMRQTFRTYKSFGKSRARKSRLLARTRRTDHFFRFVFAEKFLCGKIAEFFGKSAPGRTRTCDPA